MGHGMYNNWICGLTLLSKLWGSTGFDRIGSVQFKLNHTDEGFLFSTGDTHRKSFVLLPPFLSNFFHPLFRWKIWFLNVKYVPSAIHYYYYFRQLWLDSQNHWSMTILFFSDHGSVLRLLYFYSKFKWHFSCIFIFMASMVNRNCKQCIKLPHQHGILWYFE